MYFLKLFLLALFYGVIGGVLGRHEITPNKLSYWLIVVSIMAVQAIATLWR